MPAAVAMPDEPHVTAKAAPPAKKRPVVNEADRIAKIAEVQRIRSAAAQEREQKDQEVTQLRLELESVRRQLAVAEGQRTQRLTGAAPDARALEQLWLLSPDVADLRDRLHDLERVLDGRHLTADSENRGAFWDQLKAVRNALGELNNVLLVSERQGARLEEIRRRFGL